MPRPKAMHRRLALATAATLLYLHSHPLIKPPPAAQAHTVEIEGDVGATLHIEPNDSPRAGEEVLAWFALTRKGGQTIPLVDCDCSLVISSPTESTVAITPPLNPIDAEGYEDIPSARFTFPSVGQYTLSLTGNPTTPDDFSSFTLSFDVTVAAGAAAPSVVLPDEPPTLPQEASTPLPKPATDEIATTDTATNQQPKTAILLGIGGTLLLGGGIWFLRHKQKP